MFWGVVEHHLMRHIVQECGSAFHRLENTALAFDSQRILYDPFLFGHPTDQRLRLMDIQIIQHDVPLLRRRITGKEPLEMSQSIVLCAGWPLGWLDNLAGHDIEIDEPGKRPMSDVLELA